MAVAVDFCTWPMQVTVEPVAFCRREVSRLLRFEAGHLSWESNRDIAEVVARLELVGSQEQQV